MAKLSPAKGKTRGRNPREVEYQKFDREQPDTLPTTIEEFMTVSGVKVEPELVNLLIDAYNDAALSAASDEIGEYLDDSWDKFTIDQFRMAVRAYAKIGEDSIEEAAELIKPKVHKKFLERKKAAEEKASTESAA